MIRVGEYSTLAANYLLKRLEAIGCQAAYPERRASHEFILTFAKQAKDNHATELDIAKRLLDYNQHAPTIYLPLLVPECFLIEPTETKEAMDDFIDAMAKILEEANTNPETVIGAPFTQPLLAGRCQGCEGVGLVLPQVVVRL
jgi:glycine dehydrogenase subunit 2